jgi:hypothetical protein
MRGRSVSCDKHRRRRRPLRNAPDNMDGISLCIPLQYKNARTFSILGIVIHHYGGSKICEYIPQWNVIVSQLVEAMARYEDIPLADKVQNPFKGSCSQTMLTSLPKTLHFVFLRVPIHPRVEVLTARDEAPPGSPACGGTAGNGILISSAV